MRIALFDLLGHPLALKLERIERILPPGAGAPADREVLDLARLLDLDDGAEPAADPGRDPIVLLEGRPVALRAGAALGTLAIDPGWILPIPPYLFEDGEGAFAGLVQVPDGVAAKRPGGPSIFLLVDEERIFGEESGR